MQTQFDVAVYAHRGNLAGRATPLHLKLADIDEDADEYAMCHLDTGSTCEPNDLHLHAMENDSDAGSDCADDFAAIIDIELLKCAAIDSTRKVAGQPVDESTSCVDDGVVLASRGAAAHPYGNCKPCAWFWREGGCLNGRECLHCHACSEGTIRQRKKMKRNGARRGESSQQVKAHAQSRDDVKLIERAGDMSAMMLDKSDEQHTAKIVDERDTDEHTDDGVYPAQPFPRVAYIIPSVGSLLHYTGECKPCAWFWKPAGCGNRSQCAYCHLCAEGALLERKKKKAAHIRSCQSGLLGALAPQPPEVAKVQISSFGAKSPPGLCSPIHGASSRSPTGVRLTSFVQPR